MLAAALTAVTILAPLVPQVPLTSEAPRLPHAPLVRPADASNPTSPRSPALTALYVSFSALQIADAHSTIRALDSGAAEGNPVVRGLARHPAGWIAAKAAAGATTIWLTEKLRKKHPKTALGLMIALNAALAAVAANNYRIE